MTLSCATEVLPLQTPQVNLNPDLDREAVAGTFTRKDAYRVEDALDFLSLQSGPGGQDYAHYGTYNPICNKSASQAMVFDPHSPDFYLGVGVYYAARQNVYRVYDDFSLEPTLFRPAQAMKPVLVEAAPIHNLLLSRAQYRDAYIELCSRFGDDAQVHFLAAHYSLLCGTLPEHRGFAEQALRLAPGVAEYRLYAGLAAFQCADFRQAVEYLEDLLLGEEIRRQQPLRLYVLQKSWQALGDAGKAETCAASLQQFLDSYAARGYFEDTLQPLLDRSKSNQPKAKG